MAWTFHSVRIYTVDENDVNKPIVAKLQPLLGGTVIQTYGYENEVHCQDISDYHCNINYPYTYFCTNRKIHGGFYLPVYKVY